VNYFLLDVVHDWIVMARKVVVRKICGLLGSVIAAVIRRSFWIVGK
jgi:hypothetical protein